MSGEGGLLFSGAELETAVRCELSFVHIVLRDDTFNMVAFQEQAKHGRTSGIQLGHYDLVVFAQAFGATGMRVQSERDLPRVLEAFAHGDRCSSTYRWTTATTPTSWRTCSPTASTERSTHAHAHERDCWDLAVSLAAHHAGGNRIAVEPVSR